MRLTVKNSTQPKSKRINATKIYYGRKNHEDLTESKAEGDSERRRKTTLKRDHFTYWGDVKENSNL